MFRVFIITLILFSWTSCNTSKSAKNNQTNSIASKTYGMQGFLGYFNFYWDKTKGDIWLEIDQFDTEFLYVNSLAAGVGSNDIGLDRGQLGGERVVKFVRIGPKVLMIQPNYKYRAESNNPDEKQSVEEAFAQSVLWGFEIGSESDGKVLVNATEFFLRDAHHVKRTLQQTQQGSYQLDKSRSAIYLPRTKNFPENTEFEAILTFTGEPKGGYVFQVVPTPEAITVRQHHSFVKLPDVNYKPRVFDPRSGYYSISYSDYATPIDQSLVKRFITRHRLKKKDPKAKISEAVEPIVYYLDRGAPEPIRSALIDGARWWNQAFEAAGYKNAFQVQLLPEGVDPMDVRYNLIQWVHRSTRGWSYGGSVTDPRTGEIIKGHVSLGSLRVRQDFLIAQGLLAPYESGKPVSKEMEKMALARLRQLSAHEVGHTLGLTHNFAASVNDRASVMDYPHPYITLLAKGKLDFSKAYDTKIGEWDKRTIIYGYQDFPDRTNEMEALRKIIEESISKGLLFITDQDARPVSGAHPSAHLWDNGKDAVEELTRLIKVREVALKNFGENNIPENSPMSDLEEVLAPLYFAHRYQIEAVSKLIGGVNYSYAVRGDHQVTNEVVPSAQQRKALDALIVTIQPPFLQIPKNIVDLIPPKPIGYNKGRESFKGKIGPVFDPFSAAESSVDATLSLILNPQRASRLIEQNALGQNDLTLNEVIQTLINAGWSEPKDPYQTDFQRVADLSVLKHLLQLAASTEAYGQASAIAYQEIENFHVWLQMEYGDAKDQTRQAHLLKAINEISMFKKEPSKWKMEPAPKMPDGSPIGCGEPFFINN